MIVCKSNYTAPSMNAAITAGQTNLLFLRIIICMLFSLYQYSFSKITGPITCLVLKRFSFPGVFCQFSGGFHPFEIVLAQGFVEDYGYGIAEVQTAGVAYHGDADGIFLVL